MGLKAFQKYDENSSEFEANYSSLKELIKNICESESSKTTAANKEDANGHSETVRYKIDQNVINPELLREKMARFEEKAQKKKIQRQKAEGAMMNNYGALCFDALDV